MTIADYKFLPTMIFRIPVYVTGIPQTVVEWINQNLEIMVNG